MKKVLALSTWENQRWCRIGMLDAGMRIDNSIDPIGRMSYENEAQQYHLFISIICEIKRTGLHKKNPHMR